MNTAASYRLHTLLQEQVGGAPADAVWAVWSQLPEDELTDLYELCSVEPAVLRDAVRLRAAQVKALRSGAAADAEAVLERSEALLTSMEAGAATFDRYAVA